MKTWRKTRRGLSAKIPSASGNSGHKSNRMPNNTSALPSEYGSVYNIRILTSSEAPIAPLSSANGQDIYYNTVVGKQAVTHINQDGYSMNLIYRDPYYSGMLAQNAKKCGVLKPWVIDLESAA